MRYHVAETSCIESSLVKTSLKTSKKHDVLNKLVNLMTVSEMGVKLVILLNTIEVYLTEKISGQWVHIRMLRLG